MALQRHAPLPSTRRGTTRNRKRREEQPQPTSTASQRSLPQPSRSRRSWPRALLHLRLVHSPGQSRSPSHSPSFSICLSARWSCASPRVRELRPLTQSRGRCPLACPSSGPPGSSSPHFWPTKPTRPEAARRCARPARRTKAVRTKMMTTKKRKCQTQWTCHLRTCSRWPNLEMRVTMTTTGSGRTQRTRAGSIWQASSTPCLRLASTTLLT
mmetsp:Transcript_10562/g.24207  ORF Transcript_10562/g.24207 Transcript_10562/m.24207 type:complete len:212 (+) Transcript_10562:580-1215(+)